VPKKNEDLILFLIAAALYSFVVFYLPFACPELPHTLSQKIEVVIPGGASALEAAAIFEKGGVADDAQALSHAMAELGIDRAIKPGLYRLFKSTPKGVARQLANAKPEANKITLIPGSGSRALAALFDYEEGGRELFVAAMKDDGNFHSGVREYLPDSADARMIFLLPETYFVAPGKGAAAEFIKRASALWLERVGSELPKNSRKEVVLQSGILASLVEGEAKAADERPLLAGIFLSRMQKKMRLQSCASVVYAWGERGVKKRNLSYGDLKIDSPYNTYRNEGLPPSPICVPSEQSWLAALHPRKSDFLFFFAGRDGRHVFSKSYEEHLRKQKELGL